MKRMLLSFFLFTCACGVQEPLTPSIEKALLEIGQEKRFKAWKHVREEQVPVHKHVSGAPFVPDNNHDIQLFEAVYTKYTGGFAPLFMLHASHFSFHDKKFMEKREKHEYTIKTYVTCQDKSFECCNERIRPTHCLVDEKYWMEVVHGRLGRIRSRDDAEFTCNVQPVVSLRYSKKFRPSRESVPIIKCLSSFDEQNGLLVTFGCARNTHNLVICKFLSNIGDLIAVLKKDVGSLEIVDVIIRDPIAMMVTADGQVIKFEPYDPALFELHPENIARGCDILFDYA